MKICVIALALLLGVQAGLCEVRVFVQETNGLANINYECTAGEAVRAFALDVTVDRGQILEVTNFFRGPSTAAAQGYGIFPASLRDNVVVGSGTNADWTVAGYKPLAVVADNPGGTLPGLNSSGVTLELAAVWDPKVPAAAPRSSGTLCALQVSQCATMSVSANTSRGGIIGAPPELTTTPRFLGGLVGPAILYARLTGNTISIRFQGGELESAPSLNGPWVGTGNSSGFYDKTVRSAPIRFFRVHRN